MRLQGTGRRGLAAVAHRLRGRRYRAGSRVLIRLLALGYRPELAEVIIRDGRVPFVRPLG